MFPQTSRSPDLASLDPKIAPLVQIINQIGLPTYYSCQGHGHGHGLVQSPYPMVSINPDANTDADHLLRFIGMIGIHNDNCHSNSDVQWIFNPKGDGTCVLRPINVYLSLEEYHKGIVVLVTNLQAMHRWFDPKKRRI